MAISTTDAKAKELSRFLDKLDNAALSGAQALDQALAMPPPGLSAHEISMDKTFVRVSPAHFGLLGYRPADLVGRPVADYVVLKETAERAMNRKLSPTAVLLPYSRTFRKVDGSEVSLLLIDRHIKDAVGNVTGIRTAFAETPKL